MILKFIKGYNVSLIAFLCVLFLSCNSNKNSNEKKEDTITDTKPPLPPGYREHKEQEYCDSLKARTYATLQKGIIKLVTNDYPGYGANKRILFEKVLKKKFNLTLMPVFDSIYFSRCIMPIMDSAIKSKYGVNGKDSIIRLVNHYVDNVFSRLPLNEQDIN